LPDSYEEVLLMTTDGRHDGPVLIAYDGSEASDHAVREAGELLRGAPALVVVVWKQGIGFDMMEIPTTTLGLPPAQFDVRTAVEIDQEMQDRALRLAQKGAALANDAGFAAAEALAIAEDASTDLHEAILDVADKRGARAIVVGAHGKGPGAEIILGSTTRAVVRRADRPVVVVRNPGS
jgi:nucleotide-binding universal stress UspA family protein